MGDLLIRDAEVAGRRVDVRIANGRIVAIGPRLAGAGASIDARGGALIPGLADHHLHLLATAAHRQSIALDGAESMDDATRRIADRAAAQPHGGWLRATGLDEGAIGLPDADLLEAVCPGRPLRVQDRTGALWLFNRTALALLGDADEGLLERDPSGRATGRLWRGDAWLRQQLDDATPDLGALGAELAQAGITHVTDASATNDASIVARLAEAHGSGVMPQHLTVMSAAPLPRADARWAQGPVKLVLDERDLPPLGDLVQRIAEARSQGRAVAAHCATDAELALFVAALGEAGSRRGDRIEHGSVIDAGLLPAIAGLGVQVVTQPAFVHDRGDRYIDRVPADAHRDLYRLASLDRAGVALAGSSDAPYASLDPWAGMRAAVDRRTRRGMPLGTAERLAPRRALSLYFGSPEDPGRSLRRIAIGAPADLCLLAVPLDEALRVLDAGLVAATIIAGRVVAGAARLH